MMVDEFPHELTVKRTETVIDNTVYPPKETTTTTEHTQDGFLDTPNTSEQVKYHNMEVSLSRVLYVPFGADIKHTETFEHKGVKYKFTGDLLDQGGQGEVLSAPVERA
ncbi:hypothetical protein [Salinicoccus albus]|uniref:hypothetical protein n=1 Tax=Salinicoccus albus TaxID=418756 RepID=UPI0003619C36|nr:hypothetical protein [Salinicoccus albus]